MTFKKYVFSFVTLILMVFSHLAFAQSYDTIPLKEEFDHFNQIRVFETNYNPCNARPHNDDGIFGDAMSKILEGYIIMFQTTKDKDYLNKFVLQSLCIMRNRHDIAEYEPKPIWATQMYRDGYILAAFSRFSFLVKVEMPELYSTKLYSFDELNPKKFKPNSCYCNKFGIEFNTYGDYADWLEKMSMETMDWYINKGYWEDETAFKKRPNTYRAAEINMQIGFARALLFLGLSADRQDYMRKVDVVSDLFQSRVSFYDACENQKYDNPVFITDDQNAYWWYHRGWDVPKRRCGNLSTIPPGLFLYSHMPNYESYTRYIEDISHGVIVTWLPIDYYQFQPNTKFSIDDLIRFRNTFSKNIYQDGEFFTGVDGTNGNTWLEVAQPLERLNESKKIASLSYIILADFDGADETATEPNVYNVINDFYIENILGSESLVTYYGGQSNMAHAIMVREQWKRETVNLTLYNRKLVYNQDFTVKGTLVIDGDKGLTEKSYAEPKTKERSFIIKKNVKSEIRAGEKIILRNFKAENGSRVRLVVSESNWD